MREKQAYEKGYNFTGAYERDKEVIKEELKKYKEQGYKAVIVEEPDSPLSRGGRGIGYSIYAERKYFIDQEIEQINKRLSYIDTRKQTALEEYNKKIAEIESEKIKMEERLKEIMK
ncbi:MAG: hypothetical protein WCX73_05980 [Candidatus Pacearchaeota archaeon]